MKKIVILTEIFVLVALSYMIQSCEKGILNPYIPKEATNSIIDSGYYPNVPGCYWRYNIILSDSIPLVIDSVEVRLVKNETLPDSGKFLTYNYYHFKFGDIYSTYETLKKDSVIRYNNPSIPYKSFLLLPFNLGQNIVETFNDTTYNTENITIQMTVESYDSIFVKAGRFKAYKAVTTITYERQGTAPYYTRENLYFVPYIGFIKIENEFWDDNYRKYISKEVWEMTDYKILKKI
ncbi:MAG: hypothetical protein EPN82_11695 [Bacteroidetes bacterium]|nr:MAG: hypothetical protein EPN82_11695 [Bacteroidota bacterium]